MTRMKTHVTRACWVLLTAFLKGISAGDWLVTLPSSPICAVIGSSVVLPCSYDFPDGQQFKAMSEMWCLGDSRCITERYVYHSGGIFQDPSFRSRVEYLGKPGSKNCSLKISDLKQSDGGTYVFYLITNHTAEKMPAQRGLQLLVAGSRSAITVLAGPSSDVIEGESVSLSCCIPGSGSEAQFKWYKSSSPVPLHSGPVWTISKTRTEDTGSYFCQVQTRDRVQNSTQLALDVQYSPRNTVIFSPFDEAEAGEYTLVCMSEANPHVKTYTWYKGAACDPNADTSVHKALRTDFIKTTTTDQTLSVINLSSNLSEVHCCVARNHHGSQKSVLKPNRSLETSDSGGRMILFGVTIAVLLAIIAIVAFIVIRRKISPRNHSYTMTQTTPSVS